MIRILQYGLSPHIGGIETYLLRLAQNIDKSRYQLDFLIEEGSKPCFYQELKLLNCNFHRITPRRESVIGNKRDLEQLFSGNSFDIVHCHLNSLSYIEPVQIAVRYKIPTIVHSRNAGSMNHLHSRLLHYYHYIRLPRERITMLAVSAPAGKWMFGNVAYQVINNGIDINRFRFDEQARGRLRKELGLEECFVIGHIGSLTKQKNHEFILKIFDELVKVNKQARLILVGEGNLEVAIKSEIDRRQLKNQVILLGNRSDIPELLSAMDYFLFPSYYEGFPNALIEAQACGLPCLISDRITSEVMLRPDVTSLSLRETAKKWMEQIDTSFVGTDRLLAYQSILNQGFSVNQEIEKIQGIYERLLLSK